MYFTDVEIPARIRGLKILLTIFQTSVRTSSPASCKVSLSPRPSSLRCGSHFQGGSMKNNSTLAPLSIITRKFAVGIILASSTFALGQINHSGAFDDRSEGQHKKCSNRTLTGDYGIQIEGARIDANGAVLRTLVLAHFHGDGTLTEIDHVVLDGQPPDEEWR